MNNEYNTEDDDLIEDLRQPKIKSEKTRLESRLSISFPSKGLYNAPGDNNCFLNAAVQILWHLNVFRRSFRLLQGHACLDNACIFCALKRMFQKLQDSDASAIDPDDLRRSMAKAFVDEHRFQLGRMDDAAECFENILHRLHCHIANTESEDTCAAKHCIPHQKFASHILEQVLCKCKATGEPKSYYQFVHYVSASALSENFQKDVSNPNVLVDLLKSSIQSGEMKACPDLKRCSYRSSGKNTTLTKTTLINCPDVLTVGVIWDTDSPSSSYILDVFDCFQNSLYFKNIFDNIPDHQCKHLELKVVGVVCYYGKHYTSFFYNSTEKQWIYFDDAHVKKIGHSWTSVIEKCYRNRFQPLLVIYANFNGSPVDVSNAPTSINIVSKEMLLSKPKSPPHRKHKRKTKRSKDSKPNDHESSRSKSLSVNKTCQNSSNDFSLVLPDSSLKENQEVESFRSNKANEGINPAYRSDVSLPGSNVQKVNTRPLPIIEKSMGIVDRRSENIDQTNVLENSQKNSYIRKKFVDIKNVISPKKQILKKELLPNTSLRSNSLDSIFQNETNGDSSIFKSQYITPTVLNDNILQKQKAKLVVHQKTLSSLESKMNRSSSIDVLDSAHNQQKNSSDKKSSTRPNPNKTINSAEVLEFCHHQKQKNTVDVPNSTASKKNLTSSFSSTEVSESHNYKNPLDARNSISSKNPLDAQNSIGSKNPLDARNSIGSKSNGTSSISSTELMNYKLYDNEDDLIDLPNNTQALLNNSFTNNDGRSSDRKAVQFDFLINHAEKMLRKSLHYEESGDLLLALRHCTDATRLFRDASKLVDNDSNLVEVVDKKRWSSFSRSEMLQKKIDNYLKLDGLPLEDKTLFDASFNQQNVRNSSRNSSFYNVI
ncbi:inactive ubiquitin carboxyl-terminal hydrolase 54 isoform X4 [Hydra vulgaris]|uniref:Inactive ubiquitin carboxyl-terminal hydrolase 54 isoform X4 n=1 Tax=Hydra vulgaris TaxID=6087 RepID=A0ABM4BTT9_HYDVU